MKNIIMRSNAMHKMKEKRVVKCKNDDDDEEEEGGKLNTSRCEKRNKVGC